MKAFQIEFPFDEPVQIAGRVFTNTTNILLELGKGDLTGYGEAVPDAFITHDTPESVVATLKKCRDTNAQSVDDIKVMHLNLPPSSLTARCALDVALHDVCGKLAGKPIGRLYGGLREVPNCITIFGKSLELLHRYTEETLRRFPHIQMLKIKLLGTDDVERCRLIKEAIGKHRMRYVVDGNQCYTNSKEAVKTLQKVIEVLDDVVVVEEPVTARDWRLMKEVSREISVPVFADESAVTLEDVRAIIAHGCAGGINIKLQKTGGIWPAKVIAEECERHGLKIMVGCMLETAVGIAAGIHFAQSTKNVILSDLDYDLQLPDIYQFRPGFENGVRTLLPRAGLGVGLDISKITVPIKQVI